ncbi:motA/TolQ/ExbB proton channel family protein, partial [Vibrio parahaemolyticus AQ3810]
AKYVNVKRSN